MATLTGSGGAEVTIHVRCGADVVEAVGVERTVSGRPIAQTPARGSLLLGSAQLARKPPSIHRLSAPHWQCLEHGADGSAYGIRLRAPKHLALREGASHPGAKGLCKRHTLHALPPRRARSRLACKWSTSTSFRCGMGPSRHEKA